MGREPPTHTNTDGDHSNKTHSLEPATHNGALTEFAPSIKAEGTSPYKQNEEHVGTNPLGGDLTTQTNPDGDHSNNIHSLLPAARKGSLDIVKLLLTNRANINFQDTEGISALMEATMKTHTTIVKLLLDKGASRRSGSQAERARRR